MNEHDSETIAGLLLREGCEKAEDPGDADIIVINTCSIRENADKRFFGTLGQLKKQKALKRDFIACVCGCMAQQEHIRTAIRQSYPWVDLVFGTHNIHEFPELLHQVCQARLDFAQKDEQKGNEDLILQGPGSYTLAKHSIRSSKETRIIRVYEDSPRIVEGMPAERLYRHKAFVNIMYGCNNFCTYCIVPYTRGREKSRHPEDILEEVRNLCEDGVREVTLLGQNVNSYRGIPKEASSDEKTWDFTDLIYALDRIGGLERIRFMTSHPKDMSDRLIEAFAKCRSLCGYIHLPVQSGSSRVLKRMNRKYTREHYLELVRKLREAVPDITISTDIIVGFPGETEEDFQETLSLAREVEYDSAFTFLYSPRPGTPAAEYGDQVPEEVKHERFDRLVETMNEISARKNLEYVGRTVKVLADGPGKKGSSTVNGRTDGFKLVDFPGTEDMAGNFIDVKITEGKTFSLKGEPI